MLQEAEEEDTHVVDFDDPPALPTPIARASVHRYSVRNSLHGGQHGLLMGTHSSASAKIGAPAGGARLSQLRPLQPMGRPSAVPVRTDSSMVLQARRLRTLSLAAGGEWLDGSLFGMSYGQVLMHGFLFKKSGFFSKSRMARDKWQRRWVVLAEDRLFFLTSSVSSGSSSTWSKLCSCDGRNTKGDSGETDAEDGVGACAEITVLEKKAWVSTSIARRSPTEFMISWDNGEAAFKAQSPQMAERWIQRIQGRVTAYEAMAAEIEDWNSSCEDGECSSSSLNQDRSTIEHTDLSGSSSSILDASLAAEEAHTHLLHPPPTVFGKIIFGLSLPLLICFTLTVPDVRQPKLAKWYPVTMVMAVVWLGLLAELMMDGADLVACLLQIPDDVMGLTVTAGGTSLPNLFASVIVAKQGLGNMAVSNAFGSNTFNIFVALAVPWLVGAVSDGGSYHVAKGKIFGSIMALSVVLLCFLATLAANRLTLTPPLGGAFLAVCKPRTTSNTDCLIKNSARLLSIQMMPRCISMFRRSMSCLFLESFLQRDGSTPQ